MSCCGRDRFYRTYWVLPSQAGIYVEGIDIDPVVNTVLTKIPQPVAIDQPGPAPSEVNDIVSVVCLFMFVHKHMSKGFLAMCHPAGRTKMKFVLPQLPAKSGRANSFLEEERRRLEVQLSTWEEEDRQREEKIKEEAELQQVGTSSLSLFFCQESYIHYVYIYIYI